MLSSIENFLLRHQRLPLPHRVALLNVMETVVVDVIDKLSPELAHRICRLPAENREPPVVVRYEPGQACECSNGRVAWL